MTFHLIFTCTTRLQGLGFRVLGPNPFSKYDSQESHEQPAVMLWDLTCGLHVLRIHVIVSWPVAMYGVDGGLGMQSTSETKSIDEYSHLGAE